MSDHQVSGNQDGSHEEGRANAMTCDVEDYFMVSAFEHLMPKERWNDMECRIPGNVDRILQLFSDAGAKGTFFTLGWVAENLPRVVRRIADEGHEIASHGMCHHRVWALGADGFRDDIQRSKALLEDVSGTPVRGFRAASWSIDQRTPWAHEILGESGFTYSSSIYPVVHDHYGVPNAPMEPFQVGSTGVCEIPATAVHFMGRNWPASGGGFFRLLPFPASLWLMRRARSHRQTPPLFYFHPWEIDPHQPRMTGADRKARFRHYLNLDKFEGRLERLLNRFIWDRMDRVYQLDTAVPLRHAT